MTWFTNIIIKASALIALLAGCTLAQAAEGGESVLQAEAALSTPVSCRDHRHAGVRYHVTRLTLAGSERDVPLGLNFAGDVVGYSLIDGKTLPVLWRGSAAVVLDTMGGSFGRAYGISDGGKIVGEVMPQGQVINLRPVSWLLGRARDMGGLGALSNDVFARAINAQGVSGGASYAPGAGAMAAVIWRNGIHALPGLGGAFSQVNAINGAGIAVGHSSTGAGGQDYHAALWDRQSRVHDLGTPGGSESRATAINNVGTVVGHNREAGDVAFQAVRWQNGRLAVLPTLGGYGGYAYGINDRDDIVGVSPLADGNLRAVTWRGGAVFQLDTLVDDASAGLTITEANAINARGQIAAATVDGRAVLLTPRPCGYALH